MEAIQGRDSENNTNSGRKSCHKFEVLRDSRWGFPGGNERNSTMRKAVDGGSALRTNPVHVSLTMTESRKRAEPRMWNLVFSNRHRGSILTEALEPIASEACASDGPRLSFNVESSPTQSCRPRTRSHGEIAWARPNFKSTAWVTLGRYRTKNHRRGHLRSVYSSSQENSCRSFRGSRGVYGRAMV